MSAANKKLGVLSLAAIVVSAMIGGGIFSMPQNIAQGASVMAVAAGWLISGIGIFFLASTFRILSEVCPDATTGIVGTSGSNRSIMQAVLAEGDLAICDRNCHKSIEQGLINTGAVPIYLKPERNRYGIIAPILPEEMSTDSITGKIAASPLKITGSKRSYAVITNCTYDGLCYNAKKWKDIW